jgi:hypothetical protein
MCAEIHRHRSSLVGLFSDTLHIGIQTRDSTYTQLHHHTQDVYSTSQCFPCHPFPGYLPVSANRISGQSTALHRGWTAAVFGQGSHSAAVPRAAWRHRARGSAKNRARALDKLTKHALRTHTLCGWITSYLVRGYPTLWRFTNSAGQRWPCFTNSAAVTSANTCTHTTLQQC